MPHCSPSRRSTRPAACSAAHRAGYLRSRFQSQAIQGTGGTASDRRSGTADLRLLHVEYAQSRAACGRGLPRPAFLPTLYEGFEYSLHASTPVRRPTRTHCSWRKFLLAATATDLLLVGSNYIYPYESNRVMADLVLRRSGKVLDELYVPLDAKTKDFDKADRKIGAPKPDMVFSTVVGRSTALFYEAYRRAGFDPNRHADRQPDDQRSRSRRDDAGGGGRPHHRRPFL